LFTKKNPTANATKLFFVAGARLFAPRTLRGLMIYMFWLNNEKPVASGNLDFIVSIPYASQLATGLKL
jgi:hypothetical protein